MAEAVAEILLLVEGESEAERAQALYTIAKALDTVPGAYVTSYDFVPDDPPKKRRGKP